MERDSIVEERVTEKEDNEREREREREREKNQKRW